MKRREFLKQMAGAIGVVAVTAVSAVAGRFGGAHRHHHDTHALGNGKCSKCDCERFNGKGLTCRCGHGFYQHYV